MFVDLMLLELHDSSGPKNFTKRLGPSNFSYDMTLLKLTFQLQKKKSLNAVSLERSNSLSLKGTKRVQFVRRKL